MFAVIRERAADSVVGASQAEAFARFRATQPGYRGAVEARTADGRTMIVVLWESSEHHEAANPVLAAEARRLNGSQWSGPPRIVDQGQVVYDDLTSA